MIQFDSFYAITLEILIPIHRQERNDGFGGDPDIKDFVRDGSFSENLKVVRDYLGL